MRPYKSFLKGISIAYAAITICGCATILSSVKNPVPTELAISGGQARTINSEKIDSAKVFNSYCSAGRQIKSLFLNLTYVEPKAPSGWPVKTAGQLMRKLNQEHQCQMNRILYSVSLSPVCDLGEGQLQGKKVCMKNKDDLWFLKSHLATSDIQKVIKEMGPKSEYSSHDPVIVADKDGKLLWFNYFEETSNAPDLTYRKSRDLFGSDVSSVFLTDLSSLFKEYSILEPVEFQKKAYVVVGDESQGECGHQEEALYGVDESGNPDVAKVLEDQEKIWERYVKRFSEIKESSTPETSSIKKIQVSLDLNAFCKYGRSVQDLRSK